MDKRLQQTKLDAGDDGFKVPMGGLEVLSEKDLQKGYERIDDAIKAFTSVLYLLSAGETLTVLSKVASLKHRREYFKREIDRRNEHVRCFQNDP